MYDLSKAPLRGGWNLIIVIARPEARSHTGLGALAIAVDSGQADEDQHHGGKHERLGDRGN